MLEHELHPLGLLPHRGALKPRKPPTTMLRVGEQRTLTGLVNACCYNGHTATVVGRAEAASALCPGAAVTIHSLQSAPECNGLSGEVLGFDDSKARWNVKTLAPVHPDHGGHAEASRVLSLRASNLTLKSTAKPGERWTVRLDAPCWAGKEITVKLINLRATDPLDAMSDNVKLQMSKLMGDDASLRRGFLMFKVSANGKKCRREKARKAMHRLMNIVMFKAMATLRLNVELTKKARAEAEARDVLAREEEREQAGALGSAAGATSEKAPLGLKWKNCGTAKPALGRVQQNSE